MMLNRVRRPPRPGVALPLALLLPLVLAACTPDPVEWREAGERRLVVPAPTPDRPVAFPDAIADSMLTSAVLAALPSGAAAPVPPAAEPPDPTGTRCPQTLRWTSGRGDERVAAWWSLRPDRTAEVLASRSTDGGRTWDGPARVDTLDRGAVGCERPAPSVAVDTVNGFVHLAYTMTAPEGRGVFYAHRMDPRAAFEVPQVIVYGERPATTSVVSAGDLVLVAYEDPNTGGRPFVSVAVSRTAGHTWEERFAASEGSMSAERPLVRVRGGEVALGWVERSAPRELTTIEDPRAATTLYPTGVVVRVGRLRE
ncbi:MAG: sialidase family protein [Gemmatirosa sp.]